MTHIVQYETIDGNGECEHECASYAEAQAFVASMDGLLQWSNISNENGLIEDPFGMTGDRCPVHNTTYGEGDICGACEAEHDSYRMLVNLEMSKHQYELWFTLSKQYSYRCPVKDFDEATMLHASLTPECTADVRIARMCEQEGCEVVLHKF